MPVPAASIPMDEMFCAESDEGLSASSSSSSVGPRMRTLSPTCMERVSGACFITLKQLEGRVRTDYHPVPAAGQLFYGVAIADVQVAAPAQDSEALGASTHAKAQKPLIAADGAFHRERHGRPLRHVHVHFFLLLRGRLLGARLWLLREARRRQRRRRRLLQSPRGDAVRAMHAACNHPVQSAAPDAVAVSASAMIAASWRARASRVGAPALLLLLLLSKSLHDLP
eukprot:scaffold2823_cov373-Prasinococcus_capsulatus_cf.AAC.8